MDITSKENIVNVSKVIRHENYKPGGEYANDVAVLKASAFGNDNKIFFKPYCFSASRTN